MKYTTTLAGFHSVQTLRGCLMRKTFLSANEEIELLKESRTWRNNRETEEQRNRTTDELRKWGFGLRPGVCQRKTLFRLGIYLFISSSVSPPLSTAGDPDLYRDDCRDKLWRFLALLAV